MARAGRAVKRTVGWLGGWVVDWVPRALWPAPRRTPAHPPFHPLPETATVEGMSTALPTVRLKIERRSSHPWIFQKMVEKPAVRLPPGTVVDVLDRDGNWVGRGFHNGHSRIALRVLTTDPAEAIDDAF